MSGRGIGLLARIGIDSDALLDHQGEDRASKNVHRSLTRAIAEVGVVECDSPDDERALTEAIAKLGERSPDMGILWDLWFRNLDRNNRIRRGTGSESLAAALDDPNGIPRALRDMVDLIVVSGRAAERHDVPYSDGFLPGRPELAVAESVHLCTTVDGVRNLRETGNFRRGTQRADVEDAVFRPLAALSTHVTVLDRFFLSHSLEPGRQPQRDHLVWLVRTLDASMRLGASEDPVSTLRLLSELPKDVAKAKRDLRKAERVAGASLRRDEIKQKRDAVQQQTDGIKQRLRDQIAPHLGEGRLKRVEVVLAQWPWEEKDRPHNRHARFNCQIAISTEEGFDRLDAPELRFLEGFTARTVTDEGLLADLAEREQKVLTGGPRVRLIVGQ